MNILVNNLTRFGDLLQTQPVFSGLKAQGHRTGLLCLENFAPTAALLNDVDSVFALPGAALLSRLETDWRTALHVHEDLCHHIVHTFTPERVFNTTATLSARLLARRLTPPQEPILGFGMDAEGFGMSGDIWATFLQGASSERCNCPFHMADMFRGAAGLTDIPARNCLREPGPEADATARALLENVPKDTTGFVAFQLGASEERRQWPVARFAALGHALWTHMRVCPVLCGSPAERSLAHEYAHAANTPFVDAVGVTHIPALGALLRHSRLLVSNDTGTLHLAAGLGVPCLGIFLATAQPWDTGPYLENCCCLEPALECHPCAFRHTCVHDFACRTYISADTVFELARGFLTHGVWPSLTPAARREARAWRTVVDTTGFLNIESLSGHEEREYTQWLRLQRIFYRHIIDSCNGMESVLPSRLAAQEHISPAVRARTATVLGQAESLLHLLGEQGVLARRMGGGRAGAQVLATNERLHTLLRGYAPLAALGHLWLVLAQERGDSLEDFLQTAAAMRACLGAWRTALCGTAIA